MVGVIKIFFFKMALKWSTILHMKNQRKKFQQYWLIDINNTKVNTLIRLSFKVSSDFSIFFSLFLNGSTGPWIKKKEIRSQRNFKIEQVKHKSGKYQTENVSRMILQSIVRLLKRALHNPQLLHLNTLLICVLFIYICNQNLVKKIDPHYYEKKVYGCAIVHPRSTWVNHQ